MRINKKADFFEKAAFSSLIMFLLVVIISMLGFAIGKSISPFTIIISCFLFLSVSFFIDKKLFLGGVINILILALFAFLSQYIFDWSYDGMYYHKQAVITLKEGWNPIYQSSLDADVFASYPNMALWLDNYPKGLWIFSASIYALTNILETSKAVNILFLSALFFLAYDLFKNVYKRSGKTSFLFALLFAINPVYISQLFTFYNDLTVGVLTAISILVCIKLYKDCANIYTYLILLCITLISPLIKFTSPGLLAIVYITFGMACLIKHKNDIKWMLRPVSVIVSGFLISIFFLGFTPYTKHIISGEHLLHPAWGDEKYDIMNTNPPEGFSEMNSVQRVITSLFSASSNVIEKKPQLKIPFKVESDELSQISNADTRIGGFGVLFSGILLSSFILFVLAMLSKKKIKTEIAITVIMLALMTLFFPESWWARYASFIYYLPLFIIFECSDKKRVSVMSYIIAIAFLINSSITGYEVLNVGVKTTRIVEEKLEEIKKEDRKVLLRVNDFPTHVKLFSEYGIDFNISHEPIGEDAKIFYRNTKYKYIE